MKRKQPKNYTQEVILVFCCLAFCFFWLLAVAETQENNLKTNCDSIQANLELINTEATRERLDLENAYFDMGCNNL